MKTKTAKKRVRNRTKAKVAKVAPPPPPAVPAVTIDSLAKRVAAIETQRNSDNETINANTKMFTERLSQALTDLEIVAKQVAALLAAVPSAKP